jgi:tartrate dehydrogenase/decarboxylase/D-malate dehydrogenase
MGAVERVCSAGILTPDVGGTARTADVTGAMLDAISSANA